MTNSEDLELTQQPYEDKMPGFKILLMGASGCGKTYAIQTLIDAGITPFVIATEPGIGSVLGDIPKEELHWHYIKPAAPSFSDLLSNAKKINTMSFEGLCNATFNKSKYNQFLDLLTTCSDFHCDRTGESYGEVDDWNTDRCLVVDSLSGVNIMAMDLVVGAKPVKAKGDWGVAMDNLERLINRWCTGLQCHFILTTHLEREKDEITGGVHLMTSTLGQKLAPKIPRFFDDVIRAKRDGRQWLWSTLETSMDLKTRHLELDEKLRPTYVAIADAWIKMGGSIDASPYVPYDGVEEDE